MNSAGLKGGTEATIVAIQEQPITTGYIKIKANTINRLTMNFGQKIKFVVNKAPRVDNLGSKGHCSKLQ